MLAFLLTIIAVILSYVLQTGLFSYFQISGVSPDIMLVPIIFIAYTRGQNNGMLTGFFAGILLDLLFLQSLGTSAVIYVLIAYFAGFTNRIYDRNDFLLPFSLIAIGEFIYSFLFYVFSFFLSGKLELSTYLIYIIIPRVIYTAIVAIPVYLILWVVQGFVRKSKEL